jgi:transcription elongation factor Elf1
MSQAELNLKCKIQWLKCPKCGTEFSFLAIDLAKQQQFVGCASCDKQLPYEYKSDEVVNTPDTSPASQMPDQKPE